VRCLADCFPQPTQSNAGPDSLSITADSITLMANTPINGQGNWTISSGSVGSFSDPTNPTSVFYGVAGNTYHLLWTISNNCGSSLDTVIIGFVTHGFTCGNQLTDSRDGNSYNTIQIGSQCWMETNLAYLPTVSPSANGSSTSPYYYVYGYEGSDIVAAKATNNYQVYGALYNWPAAMGGQASSSSVPSGIQGVCPAGWHLPSDEELKMLEGEVDSQYDYPDPEWDQMDFNGSDVGGKLKEAGTTHWNSPNTGANNNSGFTALPAGYRLSTAGGFYSVEYSGYLWSTTEFIPGFNWHRTLFYDKNEIFRAYLNSDNGFSVRCLKD